MSLIESCAVVFVVNTLVYTRIQAIVKKAWKVISCSNNTFGVAVRVVKGLSAIHASNKLTDVSRHEAKLGDREKSPFVAIIPHVTFAPDPEGSSSSAIQRSLPSSDAVLALN